MNIEKLMETANNEIEFKNELQKIKEDIMNKQNSTTSMRFFIKKINKISEEIKEKESFQNNENYAVLNTRYYCLIILQQYFKLISIHHENKILELKEALGQSTLSNDLMKQLNKQFLKTCYFIFDECFKNHIFQKSISIKEKYIMQLLFILEQLDFKLINNLNDIHPIIFLSNTEKSEILSNLNVLIINESDLISFEDLFFKLVNDLTENTLYWFYHSLFDFDKKRLMNIYDTYDEKDLKFKIGKDIAEYISFKKATDELKKIIEIKKENQEIKNIIMKKY